MIDVSDGLVADLGHIAETSHVTLNVDSRSLPGVTDLSAAADSTGADWREWALAGGEDHALAATFPTAEDVPATWTVIGTADRGEGVLVNGQTWDAVAGWDHFANPEI